MNRRLGTSVAFGTMAISTVAIPSVMAFAYGVGTDNNLGFEDIERINAWVIPCMVSLLIVAFAAAGYLLFDKLRQTSPSTKVKKVVTKKAKAKSSSHKSKK